MDAGRADWVDGALAFLHGVGVPEAFGYAQFEFTANIVMFVPLGALLAAFLPRRRPIGFLALPMLSATIELVQLLALPERYATLADILANSLGAWLGLAAIIAADHALRRRAR